MARILIDGRFIGIGDSISRYTLEVTKGILDLDRKNKYTLLIRPQGIKTLDGFLKSNPLTGGQNSKFQNLKVQVLDVPHYSLSEQTKLLKYLNREKYDLVHFAQFNHPILYRGKFIVSIHDLTILGYLYKQSTLKQYSFGRVIKSAINNSNKIITVSNTSKNKIAGFYNLDMKKIVVIYNGVDQKYYFQVKNQPGWRTKIKNFKEKFGICGDYLLYTGMWKKHKNLMRMLKAFERYIAEIKIENLNVQLVLVGKIDQKEPEIINEIDRINDSYKYKKACRKVFITTGFVEEDELPIAYAGALAYVTPSLSEGFGLPPLEAMACGVPVISSKESCMPEVLGDAAYYFDPYCIEEIKKAIKKIIDDQELRERLIKKGLKQVKKYNWSNTAKGTLKIYREVLDNNQ